MLLERQRTSARGICAYGPRVESIVMAQASSSSNAQRHRCKRSWGRKRPVHQEPSSIIPAEPARAPKAVTSLVPRKHIGSRSAYHGRGIPLRECEFKIDPSGTGSHWNRQQIGRQDDMATGESLDFGKWKIVEQLIDIVVHLRRPSASDRVSFEIR